MTTKRKLVNIHVTPYLSSVWQIKVNGKRVGKFVTQREADEVATFLAKLMSPASLKLHNRRGVIRLEKTYSRADDPPETPG